MFGAGHAIGAFGKPEEVANLVSFLLSDEAGFINETVILIDGGQSYKY
ncbi:SDR family oxidoreductase [Lentibacillus sp.]|nr:SDR family oxidoreductase [Lentibacillus sp.]HLS09081.1 SDR family oxidoreductase [Lentibacillus sp.]